jgi:hypothetical protein
MTHLINLPSTEILEGILDFKGQISYQKTMRKVCGGYHIQKPDLPFITNQIPLILLNKLLKSSTKYPFLYAT